MMKLKISKTFCIVFSLAMLFIISCRKGKVRTFPNSNQRQVETKKEKKDKKSDQNTTIKIEPKIKNTDPKTTKSDLTFDIVLNNEFKYDIFVASIYLGIDDDWAVKGWWRVPAKSKVQANIYPQSNSEIYFFAETGGDDPYYSRDGNDDIGYDPPVKYCGYGAFGYKIKYGTSFNDETAHKETFFKSDAEVENGTLIQTFFVESPK